MWIWRGGGSSALSIPLRDIPGGKEASKTRKKNRIDDFSS